MISRGESGIKNLNALPLQLTHDTIAPLQYAKLHGKNLSHN